MIISDFLLFAVFGLLFCLESVIISGRGTVIIYSHLLNKWSYKVSGFLPSFGGRHLSIRTLFPPLGSAFITGSLPVIISSEGFILNPYEGRWRASGKNFFRYSEVKKIGVSGGSLLINGKSLCRMHSEYEAAWWKDKLIKLVKLPPEKRMEAADRIIASMFDRDEAKKIISGISAAVKPLRAAVNVLYIFLFIAAPLSVWIFTFEDVLFPVLAVLLVLHASVAAIFYRTYRTVFKERGIPWAVLISIAFYPPALIRSADWFFKDSLLMFNPAAVSFCLMQKEDAGKLISFLIREYTYFNFVSDDNFEIRIVNFYRESMLTGIKQLLEKESVSFDDLLMPPVQLDDMESYCPRCFCQYTGKAEICGDCTVELIKY